MTGEVKMLFQSLFYWITYSYKMIILMISGSILSFNPYFTGLPILIADLGIIPLLDRKFQSLFYWITYSYRNKKC